jgi:hypothetical protein
MTTATRTGQAPTKTRPLWFPHQHGAWAMLAVPLLLGVAGSRPDPWQLVLALAAVAAYLASATAQAWLRSRRRPSYAASLLLYAGAFGILGVLIAVSHPVVLSTAVIVVPAAAIALRGAKPGTKRDLVNSLAQAAIALALVPAAALLAGPLDAATVLPALAVATVYLVGVVLVVRSVIRERDNTGFAIASVAWHAVAALLAAVVLPPPYALVGVALTGRAAALPIVTRRRAGSVRPLRPVHVGIVEIVAATVVVLVAFLVPAALR